MKDLDLPKTSPMPGVPRVRYADAAGNVWEPGEESLRKLDELLAWCPDGPSFGEYRDVDGFDFSSWDFR